MPKFKIDQEITSKTNFQNKANDNQTNTLGIISSDQSIVLDADEQRELVESLAFNEPDKSSQNDAVLDLAKLEMDGEPFIEQPAQQIASIESEQFNAQTRKDIQVDPQELRSLLKVDINYLIEQWRQAWQSGDSETYLSLYSSEFIPSNDLALSAWQQQRKVMVVPAKKISLQLSNFDVSLDELNQQSVVSFDQQYQSSSYSEKSRKQLTLVKENEWRIVAEESIE